MRRPDLAHGMSQYLVERIEAEPESRSRQASKYTETLQAIRHLDGMTLENSATGGAAEPVPVLGDLASSARAPPPHGLSDEIARDTDGSSSPTGRSRRR